MWKPNKNTKMLNCDLAKKALFFLLISKSLITLHKTTAVQPAE